MGDSSPEPVRIDAALVRRLVAAQFPRWAQLPVTPVELDGWDNHTFRLGDNLSARLPSAQGYVAQVEKEHRWLPWLAPRLPLPIPSPVALGAPGSGYSWPWSIYRWIEGDVAAVAPIEDLSRFAADLARFLAALQRIDPAGGPEPGAHNFYRGGALEVYDSEARAAMAALDGRIDAGAAAAVWRRALASAWSGAPVWVHGDVSAGNLLVHDGRLSAVIDFGCSAVGDPACDLVIAWTFLSGEGRAVFRSALALDEDTWARARGWALWKAMKVLAESIGIDRMKANENRRVIEDVLAEHRRLDP